MSPQRLVGPDGIAETPPSARNAAALHWILRIGVIACFAGHGAFEMIANQAWIPHFAAAGHPQPWAWRLVPAVGAMDLFIAVLTLLRPVPAVLLWAVVWGSLTGGLRSLPGEPIWELLARAGTFGVPLAFMWSARWPRSLGEWFSPVRPAPLGEARAQQLSRILRVTTAALLIGHGGLGAFMHKPDWVGYLATIGVGPVTVNRLSLVEASGWLEIGLGLAILAWPWAGLLLVACAWRLGTEWLRSLAGEPMWESIERGGTDAALLALLWLQLSVADLGGRSHVRALQHRLRLRALLGIAPGEDLAGPPATRGVTMTLDLVRSAGQFFLPPRHTREVEVGGGPQNFERHEPPQRWPGARSRSARGRAPGTLSRSPSLTPAARRSDPRSGDGCEEAPPVYDLRRSRGNGRARGGAPRSRPPIRRDSAPPPRRRRWPARPGHEPGQRPGGTLRAVLAGGRRTVIIEVAGEIALTTPLIVKSFVALDGSSAPPSDITLRGCGLVLRSARDVIIRDIRIRHAAATTSRSAPGPPGS